MEFVKIYEQNKDKQEKNNYIYGGYAEKSGIDGNE
jgi:hypothetical protein